MARRWRWLGGSGGIGAAGGIAGNASGTGGSSGTGTVGAGGAGATGGSAPVIPPVQGTCPNLATGTISVTRGSRTLGGIQVVAGTKPAQPNRTPGLLLARHRRASSEFGSHGQRRCAMASFKRAASWCRSRARPAAICCRGTCIFGAGDFELADQIVACAVQNHNIDPRRIFATGCSAGGLFSGAMAVQRSNYIAAIAPNSGGLLAPGPWQNGNTPALMTIHGGPGGDVVIVDFSNTSKTADDAFKGQGGFVINCNHGGGHCGGGGLAPSIWTFFKAHPYGAGKPWSSLARGLQ